MRYAAILLVLLISNVTTLYVTKKNLRPKAHTVESVIQSLATADGIVVMGDSIVENAKFPATLCGLPILNAGIGGSGAATFIAVAQKLSKTPALIIVSVGVNDAGSPNFTASYSLLLQSLPKTRVAVVSLAQTGFDHVDHEIRSIANRRRVHLIDMGSIPDFETHDGVHPVDRSYRDWTQRVIGGAAAALGCG